GGAGGDAPDGGAMPASTSARRRFSLALTTLTGPAYPGARGDTDRLAPLSGSLLRAQPQNRCPTPFLGKPRTHQLSDRSVKKRELARNYQQSCLGSSLWLDRCVRSTQASITSPLAGGTSVSSSSSIPTVRTSSTASPPSARRS